MQPTFFFCCLLLLYRFQFILSTPNIHTHAHRYYNCKHCIDDFDKKNLWFYFFRNNYGNIPVKNMRLKLFFFCFCTNEINMKCDNNIQCNFDYHCLALFWFNIDHWNFVWCEDFNNKNFPEIIANIFWIFLFFFSLHRFNYR